VNRFVQAPPRSAGSLFAEHPILLLPELPTAMASLGQAHRAAAALELVVAHCRLDSDFSWAAVEVECRERARSAEHRGRRAA
jgi:hypothetical protein